jgi:uncharacterized protein with HEPN domain
MSRDWQAYLADIVTASEKVMRFTAGMDREAFFGDDRTFHAVIHCLLIVGEAAKHIPDDVRRRMPGIGWRKVAGMRDFLAHVYFSIDNDIVWDVIETKVPELLRAVEAFKNEDPVDP